MLNHDQGYTDVEVTPFLHQVGGHTCVLQVTPGVICKPYQEKEVCFYNNIPLRLKSFVPNFLGVIRIHCDKSKDDLRLHAKVPYSVIKSFTTTEDDRHDNEEEENDVKYDDNDVTETSMAVKEGLDTWSLECMRRQIERYGFWNGTSSQQFIMLENLVTSYPFPCVMDLKLGTKHYTGSGYTSDEKRKLLEERWLNSTSASLGFRVCGTQVYKENTKTYISRDKYHGRLLDTEGVEAELLHFFHNGEILRTDVIGAILTNLRNLRDVLKTQTTFKLFSCSLLLLYDGTSAIQNMSLEYETSDDEILSRDVTLTNSVSEFAQNDEQNLVNVDVRLIDFANAVPLEKCTEEEKKIDSGILFGIHNLIQMLESIEHS